MGIDLYFLPCLSNCQTGEQQPETYSAWESAGVNNAPDWSHAKSSLEFAVFETFGMAFFPVLYGCCHPVFLSCSTKRE